LPRRHATSLFLVVFYLFRVFLLMSRWKILSDSYSQNYRGSELHGLKYLLIWSVLFWASVYLFFKNWSLKQKSFQSYRRRIPILFYLPFQWWRLKEKPSQSNRRKTCIKVTVE
jgi:hypothetical protein